MRSLTELTEVDEPAWPTIMAEISESPLTVKTLPADEEHGSACLHWLQVTARSPLGAMALHCGGILLDHGWVRIYGGATDFPSLRSVNGISDDDATPPSGSLVVGHDVLGGVFSLNGMDSQAWGRGAPGEIAYFAPDSLRWESLGAGYGAWLSWLLSGRTNQFYQDLRWPGWETESAAVGLTEGLSVVPFLWSKEGRQDLSATSRRAVPMHEVLGMSSDVSQQFDGADPGFLGLL
ncbi:DUF2625 family protein [Fodinicola feengrottensis]|uniref:DUF2625 domain-containing protein n=1 Tax=Fodinicola feengrottensis TaxID=435914 RepID=A0ABN2IXC4_9ACTN|nr:DUF2625 family protein [Fodinicola feengrottensis]